MEDSFHSIFINLPMKTRITAKTNAVTLFFAFNPSLDKIFLNSGFRTKTSELFRHWRSFQSDAFVKLTQLFKVAKNIDIREVHCIYINLIFIILRCLEGWWSPEAEEHDDVHYDDEECRYGERGDKETNVESRKIVVCFVEATERICKLEIVIILLLHNVAVLFKT